LFLDQLPGACCCNLLLTYQRQEQVSAVADKPRECIVLVDDQCDKLSVDRRMYCQLCSTDDGCWFIALSASTFDELW